ncbi:3'-5' exonuclease [Streptomyces lydicus]|uniref:3'-5' exonuclease n=1 Tax=Streptomyces lydicus TaxID=47763 RepID=UPI00379D27A5
MSRWAQQTLADDSLLAFDLETTGLGKAWAVQIAAVDRSGNVLVNELVNPLAEIEPGAIAVHGITPDRVRDAPTFSQLLPRLSDIFRGRLCLAFNVTFDRGCIEREVRRHHQSHGPYPVLPGPDVEHPAVQEWMTACCWEDAMMPYSVWKGLWAANRGRYRPQRLGGPHDAVADCLTMLRRLEEMAANPTLQPVVDAS